MVIKDPVSGLSHLAGAILSVVALALLVSLAAYNSTAWHVVSFSIYGACMILLYLASAAYHIFPLKEKGTRILKRIDHVMIFMMIAGTYTPFCLVPLRGGWGWSIFGVVWGIAFLGIFFKLFFIYASRWYSTILYIVMGWISVVAIYPIIKSIPAGGVLWLAAGGMCYTIGAVVYARKKPDPWPGVFGFHEIWHFFVLGGSFCHFIVMLRYLVWIR
ncbi:channel protein, hemolysin III family [Denitrovibrio acetiphilus DSM 12809]|uniref:Channel protein, hemolysin III family n=1 Tax=Denitrovibrio acetiphilus (strain DSM 12809 / NBRC 114555 / N2460) TaxID=522772 RepID=D4H7B6_DENA2|nr:hemolysin III family protein [Denitrovibrio acetiphilus]ADD67915.1 channel protein, hemolysin III family [Denitrovibrio acetiphilus DSM 12809]